MELWLLAQKASITAIEAEIQGMVAANQERLIRGESLAYSGEAFEYLAIQLRDISNMIMQNR